MADAETATAATDEDWQVRLAERRAAEAKLEAEVALLRSRLAGAEALLKRTISRGGVATRLQKQGKEHEDLSLILEMQAGQRAAIEALRDRLPAERASSSCSAAHTAAADGDVAALGAAVEADDSLRDAADTEHGLTPLMLAARGGHGDCVELLLSAPDIDKGRRCLARGWSATDYASETGHYRLAELCKSGDTEATRANEVTRPEDRAPGVPTFLAQIREGRAAGWKEGPAPVAPKATLRY